MGEDQHAHSVRPPWYTLVMEAKSITPDLDPHARVWTYEELVSVFGKDTATFSPALPASKLSHP